MKVSGDKTEIRRYYLPALFPHVVEPFADKERDKAVGAHSLRVWDLTSTNRRLSKK